MPEPIEFYFDFSLALRLPRQREDRRARREIRARGAWRPMLLGVVFKHLGTRAAGAIPLKGEYRSSTSPARRAIWACRSAIPRSSRCRRRRRRASCCGCSARSVIR